MLEDLDVPQIMTYRKVEILAIRFTAIELDIILTGQLPNLVQTHVWLELLVLQMMMQMDIVLSTIVGSKCCALHDIYLNIGVLPKELSILWATSVSRLIILRQSLIRDRVESHFGFVVAKEVLKICQSEV